jgi:hypothetical protein
MHAHARRSRDRVQQPGSLVSGAPPTIHLSQPPPPTTSSPAPTSLGSRKNCLPSSPLARLVVAPAAVRVGAADAVKLCHLAREPRPEPVLVMVWARLPPPSPPLPSPPFPAPLSPFFPLHAAARRGRADARPRCELVALGAASARRGARQSGRRGAASAARSARGAASARRAPSGAFDVVQGGLCAMCPGAVRASCAAPVPDPSARSCACDACRVRAPLPMALSFVARRNSDDARLTPRLPLDVAVHPHLPSSTSSCTVARVNRYVRA